MSDLSPLRRNIQVEESRFRTAVSESLFQKVGASINLINYRQYQEHKFVANGKYGNIPGAELPFLGLDGIYQFQWDMDILGYSIWNKVTGTSGTTEIDIKRATTSGGPFTSIFSVTPKIASTAAADTFFTGYIPTESGSGQTFAANGSPPTGVTIGTFTGGSPYPVNQFDAIRVDLIDRMVDARSISVTVFFRPR